MNSKKLTFNNQTGVELSANLELPVDGKPKAYAIFAHCFTCSKNLSAVINICRALNINQIGVLRFDFTGLGQSEGEFEETNFSSNIEDLISAYQFLENNYQAPSIIIGHSLGGAAVLAAAQQMPAIQAVVTIGAPYDPAHVKNLFKENIGEIKSAGEATVSIGGRPFKIKAQLLDDLGTTKLNQQIHNLDKALLVLHSPQDKIVEINNARQIYEAAMHPKSFVTLDGADHLLTDKNDSLYVGDMIATWASRYVSFKEKTTLTTHQHVVVRTGDDGYTTQVKAGDHSFLADEPESVGGKNLGPTPYDLLVAALGTCTSMTLRMYADHKKWPLEEVMVHLQHEKIHKDDCEHAEDKGSKIDQIIREIELKGNLDDDQRKRLLEIADRCPVHKTLHSEIQVETKLYES